MNTLLGNFEKYIPNIIDQVIPSSVHHFPGEVGPSVSRAYTIAMVRTQILASTTSLSTFIRFGAFSLTFQRAVNSKVSTLRSGVHPVYTMNLITTPANFWNTRSQYEDCLST